ncbi:sensor histidine kinase [Ammoniphilus resinae]|nr:sensor histidine kinase [Ammoniphilus resinae]
MFSYHLFFKGHLKNKNHDLLVKSAFWGFSILLCMSFPLDVGGEYRLDIRIIPLLLGTLYCGWKTGIFLSFIVILYRLYSGLDLGFLNTFLTLLVAIPVILYFQKSFELAKRNKRVKIAIFLSFYYCLVGVFWLCILRGFASMNIQIQTIHFLFVLFSTWLFTTLNENIREIYQLRLEIEDAEKSRLISELTSVFAHEIRNPMQVTRGFLQLLKEPGSWDKKKDYIQISIEELDRANDVINDLLSFGKPSTSDHKKVEVCTEVRRVINIIKAYSMHQNVIIEANLSDNCWIDANPQKLKQCMINILKNAIESMPEGGTVWITCRKTEDGFVEIKIKDEGIGMTKEQVDSLGSPYYSLKESGTGLGMMVSFQIIQSLKGKVRVHSEKGIGTEFSILLPGT